MMCISIEQISLPQAERASSSRIDWHCPVIPFGEKLGQAVEYLKFRVQNFNAVAACDHVEKFISEQQKYRLFQKYFPQEWKDSRTSLFKTGHYENYTERSNEFFELVNRHLFPILSGWNEDPETNFEHFTIFSLNVDFCCEDIEYEHLRASYAMGLLFFTGDEALWEFLSVNYHLAKSDFPDICRYAFDGLWNLEKTGRCGLYLKMFEVIDHATGNPWLDTMNCHYDDHFSFDEKTINFLAESFKEAELILQETERLDELIEASPKEILGEMISLWNTGQVSAPRKKAVRKRQKSDKSTK